MGDFGIVDSIMGKMGLVGKQNVINLLGISINPMADFEPATHTCRLKLLTAMYMVCKLLLCVLFSRYTCGTLRRVQVLHVLPYVLHCTMPVMFSFSSKFHCS